MEYSTQEELHARRTFVTVHGQSVMIKVVGSVTV